jgi:hypothetical protein
MNIKLYYYKFNENLENLLRSSVVSVSGSCYVYTMNSVLRPNSQIFGFAGKALQREKSSLFRIFINIDDR